MTDLYLILGSSLSAQRDLAQYLRQHGIEDAAKAEICVPEHTGKASDNDGAWALTADEVLVLPAEIKQKEALFLLSDPQEDPRPFLEAVAEALEEPDLELARVFTIVDCKQLSERPELKAYYEMCLHFSDIFFLGNRAEVSKKWVQGYIDQLKKLAVPTRVEFLKGGGKVESVSQLLFPEARRVSQIFDPKDEASEPGLIIESVSEEDEDEIEPEETEIDPRNPDNDPYLQRFEDGSYEVKIRSRPEYR